MKKIKKMLALALVIAMTAGLCIVPDGMNKVYAEDIVAEETQESVENETEEIVAEEPEEVKEEAVAEEPEEVKEEVVKEPEKAEVTTEETDKQQKETREYDSNTYPELTSVSVGEDLSNVHAPYSFDLTIGAKAVKEMAIREIRVEYWCDELRKFVSFEKSFEELWRVGSEGSTCVVPIQLNRWTNPKTYKLNSISFVGEAWEWYDYNRYDWGEDKGVTLTYTHDSETSVEYSYAGQADYTVTSSVGQDNEAPVIKSIKSVNGTNLDTSKEPQFEIAYEEQGSGIKRINAYYYDETIEEGIVVRYECESEEEAIKGNGTIIAEAMERPRPGTYKLNDMQIEDFAGNYSGYNPDEETGEWVGLEVDETIEVQARANNELTISNITVEGVDTKQPMEAGTEFNVTVTVKNGTENVLDLDPSICTIEWSDEEGSEWWENPMGVTAEADGERVTLNPGEEHSLLFKTKVSPYTWGGKRILNHVGLNSDGWVEDNTRIFETRYYYDQYSKKLRGYNLEGILVDELAYNGELDLDVVATDREDQVKPEITSIEMLTEGNLYRGEPFELEIGYNEQGAGIERIDLYYSNGISAAQILYTHDPETESCVGAGKIVITDSLLDGHYKLSHFGIRDYAGNYREYTWREEIGKFVSNDDESELDVPKTAYEFDVLKAESNGLAIESISMVNVDNSKPLLPGQEIEAVVTVYNDIKKDIKVNPKECLVAWWCSRKRVEIMEWGQGEDFTLAPGEKKELSFKTTIGEYEAAGKFELSTVRLNGFNEEKLSDYPLSFYDFYYDESDRYGAGYRNAYYYKDDDWKSRYVDEIEYHGQLDFTVENDKEDLEAPIIERVEVSGHKAPGKLTVKLYAKESDIALLKDIGMNFVDTNPERPRNNIRISYLDEWGNTHGTLTYSKEEKCYIYESELDDSILKGTYKIRDIYLQDEAGNFRNYWDKDDSTSEILYDDDGNILDKCAIEVTESSCTDYDFDRPELVSIKNVDGNHTLTTSGSVIYQIDVKDPSGFSGAEMMCWSQKTGDNLVLVADENTVVKNADGYLCEFKPKRECKSGTYEMVSLSLFDDSARKNFSVYFCNEDIETGGSIFYDDWTEYDPVKTSEKFNFTVVDSILKDIKDAVVSVNNQTYTGKALTPSVTVKLGDTVLKNETDYTVAYSNNTNVGTATVKVTGKGNYTGTVTKTFKINAKKISDADVSLSYTSQTYTGKALTPGVTVKSGTTVLKNGTDYTVTYANNINVGEAKVTVTGKGNYTGTVTKTFKINAKNITDADVSLSTTSYTYNGKAKTPGVTVKSGDVALVNGTDYTVAYSNNVNAGTATVTVTGKGNYAGVANKAFTIKAKDMSDATVKLSTTNYTYTGKSKKPTVTVKSGTTVLNEKTDYTATYASGRTKVGRYSVKVTFKGNYRGNKTVYFEIGPKNPSTVSATLYGYDDVKVSWTKVSGATGYKVYYKKSTASSYTYYKTTTSTSCTKANLSDGAKYYFKVVAYKTVNGYKCENAGKTDYIYTLKKVSTPKLSKSGTKVKVRWTNISGESGYQISKSTSKTGTNIVSNYKTTSGTYKTLTATKGKYYYYKVRAYRQVGDKKIYGPWSTAVRYKR